MVDGGQEINHDSPYEGQDEEDKHGEGHCQPVAADGKAGSSEIGVDEGFCDVAHSLEGQASASLRLLGDVHEGVVPHDDGACEQRDDA